MYGPLLVYGTGGVAYGQTTLSLSGGGMGFGLDISTSKANWGWTAGAGFEYALTGNVSLKTEYKYVDLGTADVASLSFAPYSGALKQETKFHTVQVGLNYRF